MRAFAIFALNMLNYLLKRLFPALLCSVFFAAAALHGAESKAQNVGVLLSRDIRPYIEALEGLSSVLEKGAGAKVQAFSLEKFKDRGRDVLVENLAGETFDLFIAVGPEAVRFVSQEIAPGGTPWMYSMVLNPPRVSGQAETACGIALDIPAPRQLEMISRGLKDVKRLGILYDPRYNAEFFLKASTAAASFNLKIVPLEIFSKKDIPAALKQNWENIDALWLIPDQTAVSESIVQYIIKEALFKKTPVIGYNRFFYESGAALAFVFSYEELGRQIGRLAAAVLSGKACEKEPPLFHVWLNVRVLNKLGISLPERETPPIEAGP